MRHPETQYLDLMHHIHEKGDIRMDRTGVGTRMVFGASMRFDLSDNTLPILTTKRVAWRTAVQEMLWFLTGETNIRTLLRRGVRIWTDWPLDKYRKATGEAITQTEFEQRIMDDSVFAVQWGDLGPVYGRQWRQWRGTDGQNYDQIASVIETLRTDPFSRRMIVSGWNAAEIQHMAIPPCHMVYQYNVSSTGGLNCLMYQRSADVFLGLPFNLVGACALQMMIAQQAGLELGEFVWNGGDVHLYSNHIRQAREQLSREPRPLPKMHLAPMATHIDGYRIKDFTVVGYDPHDPIRGEVAV